MQPSRKIFLVFLSVLAGMVILACSCADITSLLPGSDSEPTVAPRNDAVPSLAGTWQDPETGDIFVITRTGGGFEVTSVTWEDTTYELSEQSWDGTTLIWTYYIPENEIFLTYETVSLSGDKLYTNWSNSGGDSGTETLERIR